MKKFFGLKKLNIKELCVLGMLTAVTLLLARFCTIRIGTSIKIPLKFISIFVIAYFYGAFWAGTISALGDMFSFFFGPQVGPLLPQIILIEFMYGLIFGLFTYRTNSNSKKPNIFSIILCAVALTVIDIFVTTYILMTAGFVINNYKLAILLRLPASIIKFISYIVVPVLIKNKLPIIERQLRK